RRFESVCRLPSSVSQAVTIPFSRLLPLFVNYLRWALSYYGDSWRISSVNRRPSLPNSFTQERNVLGRSVNRFPDGRLRKRAFSTNAIICTRAICSERKSLHPSVPPPL